MSRTGWLKCKACNEDFVMPAEVDDYIGDGYCSYCHDQGYGKDAEALEAAQKFVNVWRVSLPAPDGDGYCTLQCNEAEALADLFRAFGHDNMADEVMYRHSISDEPGDIHYQDPEE